MKNSGGYNLDNIIKWSYLGLYDYEKALELQRNAKRIVRERNMSGYLLMLEHPPTITLGYSLRGDEGKTEIKARTEELAGSGIKVYQVDRGGKATYHGPGQLVGYPVLDLRRFKLGAKRYIGKLENMLLKLLEEFGVSARIDEEYPGVWVNNDKVAALGVRIEDRLTTHGFALNVDPELSHFDYIVPCGIRQRGVGSVAGILGKSPQMDDIIRRIVRLFGEEFSTEMQAVEKKELLTKDIGGWT